MDEVHPSQRRISCETCKKYKKKCIRLKAEDVTCIKCAALGIFCDPGQRKKVGRPKRRQLASSTASDRSEHRADSTRKARHRAQNDAEDGFYSAMISPAQPTSTFEVPSWPTFMTDAWYRGVGLDSSAVSKVQSPGYDSSQSRQHVDRGLRTAASSTERPATYIVQGNKFSHKPRRFTSELDIPHAASQLEKMAAGLQTRRLVVEEHRQNLTLDATIYQRGPLFLENVTLASMVMETSEDLMHILSSILHRPQGRHDCNSDHLTSLISSATAVYCQLLSFYELFIELLTTRAERLADPMVAVSGVTLDDIPVNGLAAQGALFCNTSLTLLRRFDEVLGIGSKPGRGLLNRSQIQSLWDDLDHSVGMVTGDAITKSADLIRLFSLTIDVLDKISSASNRAAAPLNFSASAVLR